MILAALQAPFDEPATTLLVGVMLDAMPAKPGEGAAVYLDAMMFTLEELRLDDEGEIRVPTAAIAAAVQDVWKDKTFKPAISEFVGYVLKHWHQLRTDLRAVRGLSNFAATLDELVPAETEASPVPWCDGQTDDGSIPF
jgi:1,6-anhydro-N-acetylmuramate kinase